MSLLSWGNIAGGRPLGRSRSAAPTESLTTAESAPRARPAPRRIRPVLRTIPGKVAAGAADRLLRLRGVILLDGVVGRSAFADAVDRSLLDLPIDATRVLSDLWHAEIAGLAESLDVAEIPCRVMVGYSTPPHRYPRVAANCGMSVERDRSPLRGTGGLLRDLSDEYEDDDVLLVANAAQVLLDPLRGLATNIAERGGDVTVVANADGSASSFTMVTCRALRELPAVGFIDLKEQGLPQIARRHEVTVLPRPRASGLSVRTAEGYLGALRAHRRLSLGPVPSSRAFAERWQNEFAVIEPNASVAADATLHDSVVLNGGHVESGAFLMRSVVCPGARVRRKQQVSQRLVGATSDTPLGSK